MIDETGCRHVEGVLTILSRALMYVNNDIRDSNHYDEVGRIVERWVIRHGFKIDAEDIKEYVDQYGKPGHQVTG